ncbi:hypothetical protein BGX34_010826 [Mortierella sp. NVP85]|nr:hypothetical protein BGX34_010826 [Mortierella sp. NVP85]
MPPPAPKRSAITSVKYHVQQWINLVLYNSIYQNLVLLYLYRLFKCVYGFFDRSTELSRICGANDWSTPLDSLWDEDGNVTSNLVNEKHLGTIAYTSAPTAVHAHLRANGGAGTGRGRRTSILVPPTAAAPAARSSTDSNQSSQDSGSENERRGLLQRPGAVPTSADDSQEFSSSSTSVSEDGPTAAPTTTGLKHRKNRSVSTASTLSDRSNGGGGIKMDLRQSRTAAGMVYRIDRCILFSKRLTLERRELEAADCDPIQVTQQILRKKRFPDGGSSNTLAAKKLQYALEKVAATHQLAREINQRVHTKYDSTNPAHEKKLMMLWDLLRPHEKLVERYTKQWTEIGFQGNDPATDFRGMGMLGLDDLVYYAKYYPKSSKHALECSHDEISWYSFAIVGINITAFAVQTLRTRQLQYHLFLNGTDRSVYHELYCFLFHRFNQYWTTLEPKPIIMDFERVFAEFKMKMERQLARRKLMVLRFDTIENLDSKGYPLSQQGRSQQQQQQQTQQEKNGIELETRKSR